MKKAGMLAGSVLLAALLVPAGCGGGPGGNGGGAGGQAGEPSAGQEQTTFERAKERGYVPVGFANENPYAFATPDGTLTGEAVEVARAILGSLGIHELEGRLTEFRSLIPGLNANRFDIVTAGMFINPERCEQVDFANPEYRIGEAIAVRAGNPHDLHSYADIAAKPEVTVGVMAGAVEIGMLQQSGVSADQIETVSDQPAALDGLRAGRFDVITMTGPSLQALLNVNNPGDVERVMDFEQPVIDGETVYGYGAAAFRKEDDDFREAYNRELERLKESGELLRILEPFGFTENELPGDMTAEELCRG